MTEEEKKERRKEKYKEYWHRNKDKLNARKRELYPNRKKQVQEYYQENRDNILEKKKRYYQENKEKRIEKRREYMNSPKGRANNLYNNYKKKDKSRGLECTLTPEFIETKIFNCSCVYCGESDWRKLGCDRIDNDLGHTPDNIVCSCWDCNNDRNMKKMSVEEYKEYKKMR